MAVVAQQPLQSKLAYWGSSGTTSTFKYPAESPESMTDIMSYQYPPPPQNGADMDMAPSGYMSNYSVPPPSSSMEVRPQEPSMSLKDRRESISKMMRLKRSLSTPNVRPAQTPPDHAAALAADKRRNKLGYHRTSVACGKHRTTLEKMRARRVVASPGHAPRLGLSPPRSRRAVALAKTALSSQDTVAVERSDVSRRHQTSRVAA